MVMIWTMRINLWMKRHAEQAIRIRNRRPLPETTKTVAAELQDKFNVEAEVVESLDDVQDAEARKRIAAGDVVKGWYDPKTGKVCLYAPNIESKQDAMATYAHEVIAHKGMAWKDHNTKEIAGSLWGGCRRFSLYSKRDLNPHSRYGQRILSPSCLPFHHSSMGGRRVERRFSMGQR